MAVQLCIFEDIHVSQFFPLIYFRPVYNLRCGMFSLREKIIRAYPTAKVSIHCRTYLADYMRLRNPELVVNDIPAGECLFVNGRVVADDAMAKRIPLKRTSDVVYAHGNQVIAAHVSGGNLRRLKKALTGQLSLADFDGIPVEETDVETVSFPWEIVHKNGPQIVKDFELLVRRRRKARSIRGKVLSGAHLLGKDNILLEHGAVVRPGSVIDAEEGPVYIGTGATVFPQSTIIGPVCIWDGSLIKVGAQIYENTTIGPVCKVGGEVEGSIIHGYSNKQHAGFLGHSYIGSWVNLGAGTNNSDLKNNYGTVKVTLGSEQIDTGLQFVGLTMGDHSKSAINSMFNTGTVVGACSNIFGFGFPPKYVPSFSWGAAGETFTTYAIEKAIDVARRVMARRKIELTATEAKLFRKVFDLTSEERRRRGMPG